MSQTYDFAKWASTVFVGALFISSPVRATEIEILKQSDKWVANFDNEACELIAPFGEGDAKVLLRMSRFAPGDAFEFNVYGKRLGSFQGRGTVRVEFGPGGNAREAPALRADVKGQPVLILGRSDLLGRLYERDITPPTITPEQEAAITWVDLTLPRKSKFRVSFSSMAKPMRVMRTCLQSLVRSWGFDPDVQSKLSRKVEVMGNPGTWATTNDYPKEMLRSGGQGIVRFRLDVNENGATTGCRIQQRTNPDGFATLTCQLMMKRAKFRPALDSDGKAVKTFYVNAVRWALPQG